MYQLSRRAWRSLCALGLSISTSALPAAGITAADIEEVVVTGQRIPLTGTPRAASEGTVLSEQMQHRPLLRVGELLEVVPGLIVTQHTGDGKANQYFLRGFNLDHGTDFLTRVDGVPVNLPTHAHGQGYLDLNFVIPELVDRVVYRKGTYYPEYGNFSAAGAADLYIKTSARPFLVYTGGEHGYSRAVAGGSFALMGGDLLAGFETDRTDGPWLLAENLRKTNALLKWSRHSASSYFDVTASAYDSEWQATDQIPLRAVEQGTLDRFGFIDPTNGGQTHRYALSMRAETDRDNGQLGFNAYAIDYRLQLFSNFTYAINQEQGDQFEQYDDREVIGAAATWRQDAVVWGRWFDWRSGIELRRDVISPIGLHLTEARTRYQTVREDAVRQTLSSVWTAMGIRLGLKTRMELGGRFDRFDYRVRSSISANSGQGDNSLFTPKASLVLGPWAQTEFFVAAGKGFHSNDARGATITLDPVDGVSPVEPVTALAAARGWELGLRTALFPRSQVALSLWQLKLDSELLFIGDGGATEATRPSRREGLELGVFVKPLKGMVLDADYAQSRARFMDRDPIGNRIPGSVERAASLGVTYEHDSGWYAGIRWRYLGAAALTEANSVRSSAVSLINAQMGRRFADRWQATLGVYNLLNTRANDITYFYESRLPGEAQAVEDIHFHPVEPRTLRLTIQYNVGAPSLGGPSHRH